MSNSDSGVESCSDRSNEDMSVESASESSISRSPSPRPNIGQHLGVQVEHNQAQPDCNGNELMSANASFELQNTSSRRTFVDKDSSLITGLINTWTGEHDVNTLPTIKFTSLSIKSHSAVPQCLLRPYQQADVKRKSASKFSQTVSRLDKFNIKERMDAKKLLQASYVNDIDKVVELMIEKVNPNGMSSGKTTPLHVAAAQGYTEIVQVLLHYGANPNVKDVIGNTPLHLAAVRSHVNIVTILLRAGTDLRAIDTAGKTPLQIAQARLKRLKDDQRSSLLLKGEIIQIIEMMQTYLQKTGQSVDAEFLSLFSNQLNFRQTKEEIDDDVQHLLSSLNGLDIGKVEKR